MSLIVGTIVEAIEANEAVSNRYYISNTVQNMKSAGMPNYFITLDEYKRPKSRIMIQILGEEIIMHIVQNHRSPGSYYTEKYQICQIPELVNNILKDRGIVHNEFDAVSTL